MLKKPTRVKKVPKPLKKRGTSPRAKLVKKLDDIVSLIVRARDQKCVTCGSKERLGCGHLWSRVAYSTRWDLINCHAQCWNCNFRHEYDPYAFQQFFVSKFGQEEYDRLHLQFASPAKYKDFQLEEMLEELKLIYAELTSEES